ncbi:DUF4344 domain-containing metallopeptidase [Rhizobium sp. XQZ8]|uniref:DUF4344 domain-containing metallopeptidase n=1 Tax=Rhizobium populisoli TaxID=2859785 RepID=UPI001CA4C679|nr:DUF4344 domain-containing metallopeptidase [Rhizobium populisoli]MBW6421439.1 DUF4344 domain-containing metallopeptidase [Rhizobium populisoli]
MRRSFLNYARAGALAGLLAMSASAAHADTLQQDLKDLSEKQIEDSVEFAFGNALFFMFHEAGHLLVSEFGLPVLGREEDAVDTLSTLLLLEADDDVFDTALIDSVDGWTFSADASEAAEEEQALWDAHGLDRQRAFNMVCLMVGKDPKKFKQSADDVEMPQNRRQECAGEFQKAHDSWFGVLKPHLRTGDKKSKFTITYKPAKTKDLKDYVDLVKEAKVLDLLSELLSSLYVLKDGIKLTAAECGEPNAYWSADEREVTYCYELMQYHTQTVAKYFREEESGDNSESASNESDEEESSTKPTISKNIIGTATPRK